MAISTQDRAEILRVVVGMFNGAPGATILSQLTTAFEAGSSLQDIATNLAQTAEYQSLYPDNNTNQETATKIVDSILGNFASADVKADAVDLLTGMLNSKNTSTPAAKAAARAEVTLWALNALKDVSEDDAALGAAVKALNNKVEVAEFYSVDANQDPANLTAAQDVLVNIDDTDASVEAAIEELGNIRTEGETYNLSVAVDTVAGTSFDDTINAFSVNPSTGAATSTLNAFDTIDGGNGIDTLNIYTTATENNALPASATVKNVEIVNVYNSAAAAALADASKFQGVEQLWQHGAAAAVTNLGNNTTAGFSNIAGGALTVGLAASTATANVALNAISGATTLAVNTGAGNALNAVNITGSLTAGAGNTLATNVTAGATQTTLTVKSAVANTLTTAGAALVNVDASGSTGAITYVGGTAIRTIKSGAGNDVLTLSTDNSVAGAAASVDSGAGNDTITVNTSTTGDVTVNAGEGNDTINLNGAAGKVNINAGAGNDTVVVNLGGGIDAIKTTDVINGGEGTDTISVAGKNFDAEDYIILTEVITNFETLKVTTAAATIDASKLTGYTTFANESAGTQVSKVAAGQAVTTTANVSVTAAGYVAPTAPAKVGTLAGTLNVTSLAASTVTANAETVNLTVSPAASNNDGTVDTIATVLTGDVKTANITLVAKTDNAGTPTVAADDVLEVSNVSITTADAAGNLDGLTSITVSGNGTATIINANATALATVDASGLASKNIAGTATAGLTYTTKNADVAETIKLGSGLDNLTITGSTYLTMDTIQGLTLVDDAAVAGLQVDATKSDDITVRSNDDSAAITGFAKTTVAATATTLNLALVDMATSAAGDKVVFHFGGDTYIFADVAADGTAGDNILNDTDIVIKIAGLVDLDLLVSALG